MVFDYNGKNLEQDSFETLEFPGIYASHLIIEEELYVNNNYGLFLSVQRHRTNHLNLISEDSLLVNLNEYFYAFGCEVFGFSLSNQPKFENSSRKFCIQDSISFKPDNQTELDTENIIIANSSGKDSSLTLLSNSLNHNVIVRLPEIGKSCVFAKNVDNTLILFYTESLKVLDCSN